MLDTLAPPASRVAPATTLQLALLGPPMLTSAEQPVTLPRRQSRALLYRVAVAAPQPVSREQLCFLFWPDVPESVARRNLTVLFTQLRRTLPVPDALITDGDIVLLNERVVQTDTAHFAAVARDLA